MGWPTKEEHSGVCALPLSLDAPTWLPALPLLPTPGAPNPLGAKLPAWHAPAWLAAQTLLASRIGVARWLIVGRPVAVVVFPWKVAAFRLPTRIAEASAEALKGFRSKALKDCST